MAGSHDLKEGDEDNASCLLDGDLFPEAVAIYFLGSSEACLTKIYFLRRRQSISLAQRQLVLQRSIPLDSVVVCLAVIYSP
ncbi:unnamed protein product [Cuscuta campestris]|uniref:Uncharacterized protein n=1 Tax=Cuscuta campestris TaxID=132261 RepID=A0A484N622_9ASTE|nr:unnamed protein product [Cuscuta campestris]